MERTLKLLFTAAFPLFLLLAGAWVGNYTSYAYFTDAGYLYKFLYFALCAGFIYWFCQRKYVKKDIGMLVIPCIYLFFAALPSGVIAAMGDFFVYLRGLIFPGYAMAMTLFFVYLYKTVITAIRATK